ncbi:MAG: helix-turn-helix transcriptional regulator [Parvularculaceae bacterium]|nr:helix-turn-helix transcriptional regulator [Parvularculaceae bacterium]
MITEEVLDELYASIIARRDFVSVHALLADAFDSHAGSLAERSDAGLSMAVSRNLDPEIDRRYNAYYHRLDPYFEVARDMPPGEFRTGTELRDPEEVAKTEYYDAVNSLSDLWDVLGMRISEGDGDYYYFFYKPTRRVFAQKERDIAASLMPHLKRAHFIRSQMPLSDGREDELHGFGFTPAERRVVREVLKGYAGADISETLGVTENTLKWHLRNIYLKANVRSRAGLIAKLSLRRRGGV